MNVQLFNGEHVGDGTGPSLDIAVDPVDGTTLTAKSLQDAISAPRRWQVQLHVCELRAARLRCSLVNIPDGSLAAAIAKVPTELAKLATFRVYDRPRLLLGWQAGSAKASATQMRLW
jgi:hypothetical protein